jgi:hypothetical protein
MWRSGKDFVKVVGAAVAASTAVLRFALSISGEVPYFDVDG